MYKSLLVPLDGSTVAEQALATATLIAKQGWANPVLAQVHVPYPPDWTPDAVVGARDLTWDRTLRRIESDYLGQQAASMARELGRDVATSLLDGDVVDAICRLAHDQLSPLIVMSTHGRTGLSRLWLGSVADGVLRSAPCPVLLVRPLDGEGGTGAANPLRRILVPVDGSAEAEGIIAAVAALPTAGRTEYEIVQVITPGPESPLYWLAASEAGMRPLEDLERDEMAQAQAYVDGLAVKARGANPGAIVRAVVRRDGHAASGILDAAARLRADVIAMTTYGRGASRLFLGSVIDKVLRGSSTAMLVLRPTRSARPEPAPRRTEAAAFRGVA